MPLANLLPPSVAAQLPGPLLDDSIMGDPNARAAIEAVAGVVDELFESPTPARVDVVVRQLLAAFGDGAAIVGAVKERARAYLLEGRDTTAPARARSAFDVLRRWAQVQRDAWAAELVRVAPDVEMAVRDRMGRLWDADDGPALVSLLEGLTIAGDRARILAAIGAVGELLGRPATLETKLEGRGVGAETRRAIAVFIELAKSPELRAAEAIARVIDEASAYVGGLALALEPPPSSPLSA